MRVYIISDTKTREILRNALSVVSSPVDIIETNLLMNVEQPLTESLGQTIASADIIIADLSDERANVYYEVGMARGLGKPVILVSQAHNFASNFLLGDQFLQYSVNEKGIKTLGVQLARILSKKPEIDIPPVNSIYIPDKTLPSEKLISIEHLLDMTGAERARHLIQWVGRLLKEIRGWEVEDTSTDTQGEYDFLVSILYPDPELQTLGSPFPIEVKSQQTISNDVIHALCNKAKLQGFRSFLLITLAEQLTRHSELIRRLRNELDIQILFIGRHELEKINEPKDLYLAIKKSQRAFFTE